MSPSKLCSIICGVTVLAACDSKSVGAERVAFAFRCSEGVVWAEPQSVSATSDEVKWLSGLPREFEGGAGVVLLFRQHPPASMYGPNVSNEIGMIWLSLDGAVTRYEATGLVSDVVEGGGAPRIVLFTSATAVDSFRRRRVDKFSVPSSLLTSFAR